MIRTIVIDDEELARDTLITMLQQNFTNIQVVGHGDDVPSAIRLIQKHKPDLVLLDVEMPGYSGLQLLDFFDKDQVDFQIIFVTAYSEYAIRAFDLSAVDYLLKPIQVKRLQEAIEKLTARNEKEDRDKLAALKLNFSENEGDQKIALPVSTGLLFVRIKDLVCLKADGSYTEIHLSNDTKLVVSKRLIEFEKLLKVSHKFFRTHRSYLINLRKITELIRGDGGYLIMENGMEIPISKEKKNELIDLLAEISP